jgi:orotidine-5'-phosphate decarboxylase
MQDARERLIVALDVPDAASARPLVSALSNAVNFYKIGLELFTAEGPYVVSELISGGRRVFLDLKLHDIPNTVAAAARSAARLGVSMITVHAGGGASMLRAASDAAKAIKPDLTILGVTVLTSFSEFDLPQVGVRDPLATQVARLAGLAIENGCDGLVCSPNEAASLRAQFGRDLVIVTPGVRPEGSATGDQARTATPAQALQAGASHIVVGRPIIAAADPARAANNILEQLEKAVVG